MNRRFFLASFFAFAAAGAVSFLPWRLARASTPIPPSDDLLNGVVPAEAQASAASVAKTQIVHHHVCYIPKDILANPPEAGWSTYTSRVMADLGFDPLLETVHKEHHFHQVDFTYEQLVAVRESRAVTVNVIGGGKVVHQLEFNGRLSFSEQVRDLKLVAVKEHLKTHFG